MRTHVLVCGVVVLLGSIAGSACGQVQYQVTNLTAEFGWGQTYASALSQNGQVVGTANVGYVDGTNIGWQIFLYSDGRVSYIDSPPAAGNIAVNGINDSGVIVGTGDYGYYYSGGSAQFLSILPGVTRTNAQAINNSGEIVGAAVGSPSGGPGGPCMWDSPQSSAQYLSVSATGGCAYGVNNGGQIVGNMATSDSESHAFFYSGGTVQDLGTLTGGSVSVAYGINDAAQIVGLSTYDSLGDTHAFLWQDGSGMQDLGTLGGRDSEAFGINDSGLVVGDADTGSADHAFVWQAGSGMTDLNNLIPPSSGITLVSAVAINNSGQILVDGNISGGGSETDAFLLTPVSEPSTLALLGTGGLALLCYVRQRQTRTRLGKVESFG